ncbi:hypothetical protein F383_34279 [Gossypium arboreum]|uniref:Uncharacterized protein n=1 Tax=Gossypium arboreum TaxID=29729 RepID=A0A0B0PS73_GOSAR|nr:hypothetical protein F383_34279 [Gossypium arboreum]
MIELRHVMN